MTPLTPAELTAIDEYTGEVTICPPRTFSDDVVDKSFWEVSLAQTQAAFASRRASAAKLHALMTHRAGVKAAPNVGPATPVDRYIASRTWVDGEGT